MTLAHERQHQWSDRVFELSCRVALFAAWAFCVGFVATDANAAPSDKARASTEANDLRALHANAADLAEGKRVSETSCSRCHGIDGISATKGVPNLAGQRP